MWAGIRVKSFSWTTTNVSDGKKMKNGKWTQAQMWVPSAIETRAQAEKGL